MQAQFTNNKLNAEDRTILLSDKTLSKQCLSLGNYEISDYSKIGIFEVELKANVNISRNRVALRNLVKEVSQQVSGVPFGMAKLDKTARERGGELRAREAGEHPPAPIVRTSAA